MKTGPALCAHEVYTNTAQAIPAPQSGDDMKTATRKPKQDSRPQNDDAAYSAYVERGDVHAFETIVALHRDRVFDFARRCVGDAALAEDVAQDVFLKVFTRSVSKRAEVPLSLWLLSITRNVALSARRTNRRREAREGNFSVMSTLSEPSTASGSQVHANDVRAELDKLPEDMQLPLALHFLHGLSQPEVATTLGIPVGTVGSRIARGIARLRVVLCERPGLSGAAVPIAAIEAALRATSLSKAPISVGALPTLQKLAKNSKPASSSAGKGLAQLPVKFLAAACVIAACAVAAFSFSGKSDATAQAPAAVVRIADRSEPKGDAATPPAAPSPDDVGVGVVSYVKVLSDKVPDVSSLEQWKKSYIKDGMSDEEKARVVWKSVWTYQYQDGPPCELLHNEGLVQDVMKIFNVYGYSFCGVATADTEQLARYVGVKARGATIVNHVVPEMYWGNSWHLMDGSLITNFPKADGQPASIEEIIAGINDWYGKNPGLKGSDAKLRDYQFKGPGWKKGPEILLKCPTYSDQGWLPANTHGWYSTMGEYDGSHYVPWEPGYAIGYQVNIQLRKGERLTRNWSNKGLHVNMPDGPPGCMTLAPAQLNRYAVADGDLANGRVGNGTLEYDVPLADGTFRAGALSVTNIALQHDDQQTPAAHVKNADQPGELIIRMPCSYVYLGGDVTVKAIVPKDGEIALSFSGNHGLDWKEIGKITASGEQHFDIKNLAFRRYEYQLKATLKGKGTGIDALKISHDIQHSQRPLPALGPGDNTISFSAGAQEGTITYEASTDPKISPKQLVYTDYKPQTVNLKDPGLYLEGNEGSVTFPIKTTGDMTRLRFGAYYRARDAKGGWDYQVSLDGGKTFKTVDRAAGPVANDCKYTTFTDIPAGTKEALVRYSGQNFGGGTMIQAFRIDADYKEPHGGFLPVKITYNWEENGQAKQDIHVAKSADEHYVIKCATKPTMKSIVLELE
jgi:RNA polymerase sigma factor (sigma-70 family)